MRVLLSFRRNTKAIRAGTKPFYTEHWQKATPTLCTACGSNNVYYQPDDDAECGELHICLACGGVFYHHDMGYATEGHNLERLQALREKVSEPSRLLTPAEPTKNLDPTSPLHNLQKPGGFA